MSAICTLVAEGALPAVVVTMASLPIQWQREIHRFAPGLWAHRIKTGKPYSLKLKFDVDADGVKRRMLGRLPDVVILNYHKLDGWVDTLAPMAKTIVFDEIQELRIAGSLKYKAAQALAAGAKVRVGLSGTPIYNYGAEIFSVLDALSQGVLGSRKEFYQEWCGGSEGSDPSKVSVKDPIALGSFLRESGLLIRRTRKEVGRELPALTIVRHVVSCDNRRIDEAAADVAEIARRVLARAGSNFELMKMAGEINLRMRQATGIGKAAGVADLVQLLVESGENVVLYGWHRAVYEIWKSAFERTNISYAMYTGQENERAKVASIKQFAAGEARVLIISLRAGAGLDGLQHVTKTVVAGELDWSPPVHAQDIGRVHRDGQRDPVFAYFAVAEEGSDPAIEDVLGLKEAQSTGIIAPERAGIPQLVGGSEEHIRRVAEDVLRRLGEKHGGPSRREVA